MAERDKSLRDKASLREEGFVNELVHYLQQLRKKMGTAYDDRIAVVYDIVEPKDFELKIKCMENVYEYNKCNSIGRIIEDLKEFIMGPILAVSFERGDTGDAENWQVEKNIVLKFSLKVVEVERLDNKWFFEL